MTSAMDIKPNDVQKLRQTTGAGLMDCKKALVEAGGDMEKAIKILREKGIAKSSKRLDRTAGEGLVETWISPDGLQGIIFEMNCETDFVARNAEFVAMTKGIVEQLKNNPGWTTAQQIPQEPILEFSGKIGEKIEARRFGRLKTESGVIASYIHPGAKLGVLVQLDSTAGSDSLKDLAKEVALQIAGVSPNYLTREEVPAEIIDREKEIAKKQLEGQNKPAEILEKIAVGKLEQFYAAQCLVDQPYVKDSAGKTKISDLLSQASQKVGAPISIKQFFRFRVGAE
jgi:elongation factor Ts